MALRGAKPRVDSARAEVKPFSRPGQINAFSSEPPEPLTPVARKVWDSVLPDMIQTGVFAPGDVYLLVEWCELMATAAYSRQATKSLERRLATAEASEDDELAEALSSRLKRARVGWLQPLKIAQSIAGDFGMNPVARVRLGLMNANMASLLDAFGDGDDD